MAPAPNDTTNTNPVLNQGIILASQSPRRKQLLEWAEVPFEILVKEIPLKDRCNIIFEMLTLEFNVAINNILSADVFAVRSTW